MEIMEPKEIEQVYITYIKNVQRLHALENTLFQETESPKEWMEKLRLRSEHTRELYQQNEELLNRVPRMLVKNIAEVTPELAQIVVDNFMMIQKVYPVVDYEAIGSVLDAMREVMEEKNYPMELKIKINYLRSYQEGVGRQRERGEGQEVQYDLENWKLREHFHEEQTTDLCRTYIILAGYNYLIDLCSKPDCEFGDKLTAFDEYIDFLSRPEIQQFQERIKKISLEELKDMAKEALIEGVHNVRQPKGEDLERVSRYAQEVYNKKLEQANGNPKDVDVFTYVVQEFWKNAGGSIDNNQYFQEIYQCFMDGTSAKQENSRRLIYNLVIAQDVLWALQRIEAEEEEKARLAKEILGRFLEVIKTVKFGYENEVVLGAIGDVLEYLPMYQVRDVAFFRDFLLSITVRQQVQTSIHVTMVGKLCMALANEIMKINPGIFEDTLRELCSFRGEAKESYTPQEILDYKEELLRYVETGALLHDIGKSKIATIINLQSRKMSDNEFAIIKEHPRLGAELLENFDELSRFADVVKGHHKFYNGQGGYPREFDNTKSPFYKIINMVTICDSIDAATDCFGRNYVTGKDFYFVLQEMIDDEGVRYDPELVKIMVESKELQGIMNELVTKGREEVYYQIYSSYVEE